MQLIVHRVPHSTNVERISIAAGIKRVDVEWVDHDDADRSAIERLSGQPLVPVAEFDGEVIADSIQILRRLEQEVLDPPLWPIRKDARARSEIFISWFNELWKVDPNALAGDGLDPADAARHSARLVRSVEWFEDVLSGPPFLGGMRATIDDICAYPFLRYADDEPVPGDGDPFHAVLHEHLGSVPHPKLSAWIERMRELPRA